MESVELGLFERNVLAHHEWSTPAVSGRLRMISTVFGGILKFYKYLCTRRKLFIVDWGSRMGLECLDSMKGFPFVIEVISLYQCCIFHQYCIYLSPIHPFQITPTIQISPTIQITLTIHTSSGQWAASRSFVLTFLSPLAHNSRILSIFVVKKSLSLIFLSVSM